jgi:hypothetical protein|tara:strand:- start:2194 stop:2409 length:216 start_codon:yes stop_codon:yes gene_type:complete
MEFKDTKYAVMDDDSIVEVNPKEIFTCMLRYYFRIPKEKSTDIANTALDLFHLDKNGKLPLDWNLFYKNQV